MNFYQSTVEALPGPNNRLDGQQPWSGNLGFDYRARSLPVTMGGSVAFTPGYATRQSMTQTLDVSNNRSIDLFVQWVVNPKLSARFSANNLSPLDNVALTQTVDGYSSNSLRSGRTHFSLGMDFKL